MPLTVDQRLVLDHFDHYGGGLLWFPGLGWITRADVRDNPTLATECLRVLEVPANKKEE